MLIWSYLASHISIWARLFFSSTAYPPSVRRNSKSCSWACAEWKKVPRMHFRVQSNAHYFYTFSLFNFNKIDFWYKLCNMNARKLFRLTLSKHKAGYVVMSVFESFEWKGTRLSANYAIKRLINKFFFCLDAKLNQSIAWLGFSVCLLHSKPSRAIITTRITTFTFVVICDPNETWKLIALHCAELRFIYLMKTFESWCERETSYLIIVRGAAVCASAAAIASSQRHPEKTQS